MNTREAVERLIENGYPLGFIAKMCGMPYMHLYRSTNQGRPFTTEEEIKIKRFAVGQPCMEE